MINDLVKKLSTGNHEIELNHRGDNYEQIKERINSGYILVKFINTLGGTEIGINIDKNNINFNEHNDDEKMLIEGTSNLNYNKVKCIITIDKKTLKGKGYLKVID